jgi:hypothetical protein
MHGLDELKAGRVGQEILDLVVPADRREVAYRMHGLGPQKRIVVALQIPQVVMGVDDPHDGSPTRIRGARCGYARSGPSRS